MILYIERIFVKIKTKIKIRKNRARTGVGLPHFGLPGAGTLDYFDGVARFLQHIKTGFKGIFFNALSKGRACYGTDELSGILILVGLGV
jgi:hypothetical protein